jgi:hypothetical protein
VILGIPDESQFNALRKEISEAPHFIRDMSNIQNSYSWDKKNQRLPFTGIGNNSFKNFINLFF